MCLEWTTRSDDDQLIAWLHRVEERLVHVRQELVFVPIEIRTMPLQAFQRLLDSPLLGHYRHWLEFNRSFAEHTLSEAEGVSRPNLTLSVSMHGPSCSTRSMHGSDTILKTNMYPCSAFFDSFRMQTVVAVTLLLMHSRRDWSSKYRYSAISSTWC